MEHILVGFFMMCFICGKIISVELSTFYVWIFFMYLEYVFLFSLYKSFCEVKMNMEDNSSV